MFPVQQADLPHGLQRKLKAVGNVGQLLVNNTGKSQQMIFRRNGFANALIVQCLPEFSDGRILFIFSLLKFAHDKVKEFLTHC
jgi:hypothetical protein